MHRFITIAACLYRLPRLAAGCASTPPSRFYTLSAARGAGRDVI